MTAKPGLSATGFHHEAFFYAGDEEFIEGAIPYLEEGVAAGDAVLVVLPEPRLRLVQDAMGPKARAVEFWPMGVVGRNPGRLIAAWRDYLSTCDPEKGVRGLGEPVPAGRSSAEVEECLLNERLFNIAFGGEKDLTVMCPYDTSTLDDAVLEGAQRSHPFCAGPRGKALSPRYDLDSPLEGALSPLGRPSVALSFGRADLAIVRHFVAQCARTAGLDTRRNEDLVLAVCEAATNSIQHGGGEGSLHVWDEDGSLICSVRDSGRIENPLVGRERPAADQVSGRGLWIANQLCDLVQIRSGAWGTEVRIRVSIDG